MLSIQSFTVNPLGENCYVAFDATREAVIVDCGALFPGEQERLAAFVSEHGLTLRHHLLTHAHFDHIFGAQFVADKWGVAPTLAALDVPTYEAQNALASGVMGRPVSIPLPAPGALLADGDVVRFGVSQLRVIATPGHTPGGVCFYAEADATLFSGDTLFRRSVGRTDLAGGSTSALYDAIENRLFTLPDAVRVLPGHGPSTTIGEERRGFTRWDF